MKARHSRPLTASLATLSVVLPLVLATPGSVATADATASAQDAREVQTIWTGEFHEPHPTGLAYLPGRSELLVADVQGGTTSVLRLSFAGDSKGSLRLPALRSPNTLAFDAAGHRLTALSGNHLVTAAAGDLQATQPAMSRTNISDLGLQDPQGATFDPASGTWYILDDGTDTVVEVSSRGRPVETARISLQGLGAAAFRGIAFNPNDGLLYVASLDQDQLYALDGSGAVAQTYGLGALGLQGPMAMTFAPSADATDAPSTQHLFIVDAGTSSTLGGVMEVTLAAAVTVAAPTLTATLVQTIATSAWNPGSPDPSGIEYLPGPDRLEVCDSEVEEVTGAGYHGVNLWQSTRTGTVTDTGTTSPAFSKEPTGLGYDPGSNTLFISDDSAKRVWIDKTGPDGRFGTSDDVVTSVNAGAYGSGDTEDPEFDATSGQPTSGHLFFLDGTNTEVYDIDPVNGVFGDGNDVMTHFDVGQFGPSDWEGLGSDPATGNLLVGAHKTKQIFEVTKSGSLVRIIDASGISGLKYISGLAMAPASDGSGQMNYWIVDRAIDNSSNPQENDGKLFEVMVPGSDAPPSVSVTSPSNGATVSGTIPVTASATDDHGVTKVEFFDGATSLGTDTNGADGWSVFWNTTTVADGAHSIKAVATDTINQTGTSATVGVTVDNVDSPPTVTITSPADGSGVKGTVIVQAVASDDKGLTKVEFFDGPTSLGTDTNGADGWSVSWNTTLTGEGAHTISATATDTIGQTASDSNTVTVDNTPPAVSVTSPAPGATVSGTITVQADPSDGTGSGVTSVQFFAGVTSLGTDSNGVDGWSVPWNTLTAGNGNHDLTATATDAAGNSATSAPVTVTVDNPLVIDIPIATSANDAEEKSTGGVNLASPDLDLIIDKTSVQRAVGLRFTGVGLPQGATITKAYVQFQVDEKSSDVTNLVANGEASDNAAPFTTANSGITSRARTGAAVNWTPPAWPTVGARGTDQRTPDLSPVLQEIVSRSGWSAGNALVLIITGSGKRTAESFNGTFAPVLHIEYAIP